MKKGDNYPLKTNKYLHMKNIYALLLVVFVFGCQSKSETTTTEKKVDENQITLTANQFKNANLTFGTLQQQAVNTLLKVNGKITLSPQALASVSMPLGGYIKEIKVMPGMYVNQGQILAVIEDQSYVQLQQEYLNMKQQLAFSSKDYQRQKELNASLASSDKMFQLAESEYAKNKITVKALSEKLKLIAINPNTLTEKTISKSVYIKAPISGMVTKTGVNIGKYVTATDELFQIMNAKSMYAQLHIFDKDAAYLSIGQKVKVYTNAQPDVVYTSTIQYVNKSFDNSNNTIEVYAKIVNSTGKLIPGNYVNAQIELSNNHAYVINEDAIVTFENKNYLFVVQNDQSYKMEEVKVGITSEGVTEILNSEAFSDKKIVTKNAYTLLMALKNKEE